MLFFWIILSVSKITVFYILSDCLEELSLMFVFAFNLPNLKCAPSLNVVNERSETEVDVELPVKLDRLFFGGIRLSTLANNCNLLPINFLVTLVPS